MSEKIVNKVANSGLISFDLEEYYPKGERVIIDLKDWLFEGLVLKEKDFRKSLLVIAIGHSIKTNMWP